MRNQLRTWAHHISLLGHRVVVVHDAQLEGQIAVVPLLQLDELGHFPHVPQEVLSVVEDRIHVLGGHGVTRHHHDGVHVLPEGLLVDPLPLVLNKYMTFFHFNFKIRNTQEILHFVKFSIFNIFKIHLFQKSRNEKNYFNHYEECKKNIMEFIFSIVSTSQVSSDVIHFFLCTYT